MIVRLNKVKSHLKGFCSNFLLAKKVVMQKIGGKMPKGQGIVSGEF